VRISVRPYSEPVRVSPNREGTDVISTDKTRDAHIRLETFKEEVTGEGRKEIDEEMICVDVFDFLVPPDYFATGDLSPAKLERMKNLLFKGLESHGLPKHEEMELRGLYEEAARGAGRKATDSSAHIASDCFPNTDEGAEEATAYLKLHEIFNVVVLKGGLGPEYGR